MADHLIEPRGPFSLAAARDFAGGFAAGIGGGAATGTSIVMAFPIEPRPATGEWAKSAVVELTQVERNGSVTARVATDGDPAAALAQAQRCVSLDHDGSGWPDVGKRDPVIGDLQATYEDLRPVCFYSAYEAATSFVIGQRISRVQASRVKARLSERTGDELEVDGVRYHAFPRPERLLQVDAVEGLPAEKVRRLHGLAEAALDGRLDTNRLRSLPASDALTELRTLHGIGEFSAQGILLRGCGLVDQLPDDALSDDVLATMYADDVARGMTTTDIVSRWVPYRTWATVLLRVGWGRGVGEGQSYRRGRALPGKPRVS